MKSSKEDSLLSGHEHTNELKKKQLAMKLETISKLGINIISLFSFFSFLIFNFLYSKIKNIFFFFYIYYYYIYIYIFFFVLTKPIIIIIIIVIKLLI